MESCKRLQRLGLTRVPAVNGLLAIICVICDGAVLCDRLGLQARSASHWKSSLQN